MNINHTNIDQYLFDYFEGNLLEQEKGKVLNFIHQNPQYEKEFALWAKTYVCVDNTPKDYGLSSTLLKPEKKGFNYKPWFYGGIVFSILVCVFWLRNDSNESQRQQQPTNFQQKNVLEKPPEINQIEEFSIKKSTVEQKEVIKPPKILKTKNPITIKHDAIQSEVVSSKSVDRQKENIKKQEAPAVLVHEKNETLTSEVAESIQPQPQIDEHNADELLRDQEEIILESTEKKIAEIAPDSTKKPARKKDKPNNLKLPMDLKPDEEFIPVNSNF